MRHNIVYIRLLTLVIGEHFGVNVIDVIFIHLIRGCTFLIDAGYLYLQFCSFNEFSTHGTYTH